MIRIRLWPVRRDEGRRSDWPAHVVANDAITRIDRSPRAKSDRLHVCRDKWQVKVKDNCSIGGILNPEDPSGPQRRFDKLVYICDHLLC